MKDTDKDFLSGFFIACFVSCLFYYVNRFSVRCYLDLYYLYLGIFLPFCLPIGIMIKTRLDRPEYIYGY